MELKITPDIAKALGHYVYAYIDPRDKAVFYIGRGTGARATDHLFDKGESKKTARINDIRAAGLEPCIDILAYQLRDEMEASRVETALIEFVGVDRLSNCVRGDFSMDYPRRKLSDFISEHEAKPLDMTDLDPALLIRIPVSFSYKTNEKKLYENTRGTWKISSKRQDRAKYAMAVYAGVIREVYEIESWHPAGSTPYDTRDQAELAKGESDRCEFLGHVASEPKRSRYLHYSVKHLFKRGDRHPTRDIGPDDE